jgi:hypothetical protein
MTWLGRVWVRSECAVWMHVFSGGTRRCVWLVIVMLVMLVLM